MTVKEHIKHTGATFTPIDLAEYLARKLINHMPFKESLEVLDPACGEGELLLSISKVLCEHKYEFSLTGYDSNNEYLSIAKERLVSSGSMQSNFVLGDFLEAVDLSKNELLLDFDNSKKADSINGFADLIIANPPYVRTQILGAEKAQKLAKKFSLKGRVDLYYPFLIAMTESLKEDGILGVITSNRYLSTKGGESIRKYLAENYEIIEIIDLGDTKLFDAAVLPAIFIGRKRKAKECNPKESRFIKIYEELNGYEGGLQLANSVFDILNQEGCGYFLVGDKKYKKTEGVLEYNEKTGSPWVMLSKKETDWVTTIDKNAACMVGDLFKVRVGIKTTADKVFISDKWEDLGDSKPENELLRDLISQENIGLWGISDNINLRVLYTHYDKDGKKETIDIDKYPKAKKYFLSHEKQLKGRKYVINAGRNWFEIWVSQKPNLWSKPKLVFPDISVTPRFYFDTEGKIVNGNCYWIVGNDEDDIEKLLLIQGVANSKLMTRYHDLVFNNKLYSGRRRYFTQYVERYPLPEINSKEGKTIIQTVKKLNKENDKDAIGQLVDILEISVAKVFGVPPVFNLD
ncbi:MAG: N-6 DNA methylase [Lewinellaceae bacterium]|nr:N-6 DNA methylase [Lewinellaceae bacterium]